MDREESSILGWEKHIRRSHGHQVCMDTNQMGCNGGCTLKALIELIDPTMLQLIRVIALNKSLFLIIYT